VKQSEELTVVFRCGTLSAQAALHGIQSVLAKHHVPTTGFMSDSGKPTSLASASSRFERLRENTFHLEGHDFKFDLSLVRNSSLEFLAIQSTASSRIRFDDWVAPFTIDSSFVMAWVSDVEYAHWQNAFDPLQYSAAGRPFDHLPMKSNGLPYPLEQKIIDTSSNPGRRILRNGYIETIGSTMWLGQPFWSLTHADRDSVEGLSWLHVSHPAPEVIRIQTADECFTTAEGQSGEMQRALRAVLFQSHATDYPPRSG